MKYYLQMLRYLIPILLFVFMFVSVPVEKAQAQMFSVEKDDPVTNRSMIPNNGVYIGLEPAEFIYKGSMDNNTFNNAGAYEFDGSLIRVRFETIGFEAFLGVGGQLTGIDDVGYFDVGAKAVRGIRIVREKGFGLLLPLQLKTSMNSVTSSQALSGSQQFRQGTFEFGGGMQVRVRLGDKFRFSAEAIPNYGFSFASGGIFGGQIYDLETKSRFYIDRVFGDIGITAGWDYNFKRFDVEENEFDYNLRAFSFLLGITF